MDRYLLTITDLTVAGETEAFRASIARLLANESGSAHVRECEPLGFSKSLWTAVTSLGIIDMAVPSSEGPGARLCDMVVIAEEFGRRAAPVPVVSHIAASRLI